MKRYGLILFIVGLLLLLLSHLFDQVNVGALSLRVGELTFEVAATLMSISFLAVIYYLFGEEPTVKMIRDLQSMLEASKVLHELGIERFVASRSRFDVHEMHSRVGRAQEVFIVARYFHAIKYTRVQELFRSLLSRPSTSIRILLSEGSPTKEALLEFKRSLPEDSGSRLEIREVPQLACGMYGTEHEIYVTLHLSSFRGDESPSMLCSRVDEKSLYYLFYAEYTDLWKRSTPLT